MGTHGTTDPLSKSHESTMVLNIISLALEIVMAVAVIWALITVKYIE